MNQKHFNLEIDLRNNSTIRNMFAEIVTIICLSNKKTGFETLKINKDEEFDLTNMKEHFKAKDTNYANEIFSIMMMQKNFLFLLMNLLIILEVINCNIQQLVIGLNG